MARRFVVPLIAGVAVSLALLAGAGAAQTAPSAGTMNGGPARTGQQPGPGLTGPPQVRWSFAPPAPSASFLRSQPVVDGGAVYVAAKNGSQTEVFRVDAATGHAASWSQTHNAGLVVGDQGAAVFPFAAAGGALYVGTVTPSDNTTDRAELTAYDAKSGAVRWRLNGYGVDPAVVAQPANSQQDNDFVFSPAIVDGTVYVAVDGVSAADSQEPDGLMVAVDAKTGKVRWHVETHGSAATPSVAGGIVYVGVLTANDSFILALDAKTGKQVWRAHVEAVGPMPVAGGLVYTTTETDVVALDAKTGAEAWRTTPPAGTLSMPAVAAGTIYVTDTPSNGDVTLAAMDAKTGKARWTVPVPTGGWVGAPQIAGGVVYLSVGTGQQVAGSATATGGAALVAFDAASGNQLWRFAAPRGGSRYSPPAVVGGSAYVETGSALDALSSSGGKNAALRLVGATATAGR